MTEEKEILELNPDLATGMFNISETALKGIYSQRENILQAFIAETGCKPSEAEQVVEFRHFGSEAKIIWKVRKRGDE
jgi:hypothetical protein